jgi:pimeloyl-ACP methyl ester carboxylesterase
VLPALERRHQVLAPTLAGHAGGPPVEPGELSDATLADAVERAMDDAGLGVADIAGNSLGGYVALQLAARGRASSVVALAPAGGWAPGDESYRETLAAQAELLELMKRVAPLAGGDDLIAHQMLGVAAAPASTEMLEHALREGWAIEPERITCPVRIVWGTEDHFLPWPAAATRYREEWLPHADWVVLDGVGHAPQLEVPLEAAELILGFTAASG